MVSFVAFSYVAFWYFLVPALHSLLSLGAMLSSPGGSILRGIDLLRDESRFRHVAVDHVIALEAQQYAQARNERQFEENKERLKLLERMDPDFFRRNDPSASSNTAPDEGARRLDDKNPISGSGNKKDPGSFLRTLDNMGDFDPPTSCPEHLADDDIQTTLVVQASVDRLWVLNETCNRWKDPIVAVVAIRDRATETEVLKGWSEKCPQLNLITHALEDNSPEMYPVNKLRNLALDAVRTSHLLVVDVDFVPSDSLDKIIKKTIQTRTIIAQKDPNHVAPSNMDAVVVPAFARMLSPPCSSNTDCMRHLQGDSSFIPRSFDELVECHTHKDCIVFQSDVNSPGHSSTRSIDWLQRQWYDDTKTVVLDDNSVLKSPRTIDCFDSFRYEPYLVLRWCPSGRSSHPRPLAPYYDERFHGYGKNKIQHVQHLRMMGYRFVVLPEGFIVHNPHVESEVKEKWNDVDNFDLHGKMDELYRRFLGDLFEKYYGKVPSGIIEQCTQ